MLSQFIFQDIYMILHQQHNCALNCVHIDFQGQRSKVKVTRSKTLIFSFFMITQKVLDQFWPNKNQNTQYGLALMSIAGLSPVPKVKVTVKSHRSPISKKKIIFFIFTARISKLYSYVELRSKINISWWNFSSTSKVKVEKWRYFKVP